MVITAALTRMGMLVALLGAAGCNIQTPQLEALRRDMEVDPRERVRVYDSCRARSKAAQDLESCMRTEGYKFVSASAQDYRAAECWDDRYNDKLPKAFCFDKE